MQDIHTTGIIGMGALGVLFGVHIMEHDRPDAVRFILDPERMRKYAGQPMDVNGTHYALPLVEAPNAAPVDLLIVAVKSPGLAAALDTMRPAVGPGTIIVSILNGVTSEEIIAQQYGDDKLVYCIAQGMDAVKTGQKLTFTHPGQLRFGARTPNQQGNVERLAHYFSRIALPHAVETDIMRRMWAKFMLNVGINQTCTVCQTNYGGCSAPGQANRLFIAAMREAKAIANAEGYALTEQDINEYAALMASLAPDGIPSMRQDALAHRPTEVDLFADTVVRLGKKHNIRVPVNEYFLESIRTMEQNWE